MKLTTAFILLAVLTVHAKSYSQQTQLSFSFHQTSIADVLTHIEEESEYYFFYKEDELQADRLIDINISKGDIHVILNQILEGTGLTYSLIDRYVVISAKDGVQNQSSLLQQKIKVSGKVTDTSGLPLPGVTVVIKGTTNGTITNFDGEYALKDVPSVATIQFSFVGMKMQEIPVEGKSSINVIMAEDAIGVEEVVVTAFGITREKKQLSYSTQQVEGEKLGATGNNSAIKALQGKVAGLTIRQQSGMPGSNVKVTIRGSNSIRGDNSPLYVVDGFPIEGGISLNIDPNDIENMSVLKGASAAALYGLRASNGVILITTKRGEGLNKNKPVITLNTNYSFDRLSVYPETQKIYGQGVDSYNSQSAYSWGYKISEWGTYTNQFGEQEEAKVYDNARDFLKTGGTLNSNINIANKFDKGNYSIGIGYSGQEGIVPNTDMARVSVKLAGDYKISDKIKVGTLVNYSTWGVNGIQQGGGGSDPFYAVFNAPPSYNLKGKPNHVEGNEYQQINFRTSHDNIYWLVDHNKDESRVSSLIGNINFDYSPTDWLNFNYRIGVEEQAVDQLVVFELGSGATGGRTNPPSGGSITTTFNKRKSINSTFITTIKKEINDKLKFDLLLGHEFYDYNFKLLSSTGNDFTIGGFHKLSNCETVTSGQYWERKRSYALFGNLNVAYDNMLFLTLTGRNDVVSNMPRQNRSFFYPSAGLGFVFTEAMELDPGLLSFGKVRMSYAEVGQAGSIYSTVTTYYGGSAESFYFPFNGVNAFTMANSLKSTDLVPENTKTWEAGLNLGLFNNRLSFDYTYYNSSSEGQIFSVPISSTTGFTSETRNAGEMQNIGHELVMTVKPIVTDNFSWDFTTNFTTYTNKVVKLAEGIEMLTLATGNRVSIVAKEGEEYPILRGVGFARDEETGKIVVDSRPTLSNGNVNPSYGMPLQSKGDIDLGKVNPDFEMNIMNTFKYKNISLYAQIDWRQGGKIASGDSRLSKLYGTHYDTQFREDDYVEDAVKGYYDGSGNLVTEGTNDIVIKRAYQYFRKVMDPIRESNVYDATFIRLRELKLSYDIPTGFLKQFKIDGASVYAVGRNLWLIKSGLPHYDPEMSDNTSNAAGETYGDYPQVSSFGVGVNLTF